MFSSKIFESTINYTHNLNLTSDNTSHPIFAKTLLLITESWLSRDAFSN